VAYLLAQGSPTPRPHADPAHRALRGGRRQGYFALQTFAEWLMAGHAARHARARAAGMGADRARRVSFGLVAIAQALFPLWANHPAAAGLRVHLSNGLYANAVFDKLIGNWSIKRPS
jgi:NAD(P)H-quinone oxidoreductase subunit 5